MESWTVAQRATGVAKGPVRLKRNRGRTTKQASCDGADVGRAEKEAETPLHRDRSILKEEMDQSQFASVSANIVLRERDRKPVRHSLAPAESSRAELHKSRFLNSTAGVLMRKGEAKPSTIATPPTEVTTRPNAAAARDHAEGEIRSLRDELAALRSTVADRETALARAALEHEQARAQQQEQSQNSLSKAEQVWKGAEAIRFTKVEAEWQERSARALAEVRAEAQAARDQADGEVRRLRDELATVRSTLADRETTLANVAAEHERHQQESQAAFSEGEHAWKVAEAIRFTKVEAEWQERSARALAEVRAEAQAARDQADGAIRSLRDELAALRSALTDRATALAQASLEHERARERLQLESQAAFSAAEQAWKAAEAIRFTKVEAEWQERSARALAEVRAEAQAASDRADGEVRNLRDELAALGSTLADRETTLAKAVLDTERERQRGRQELEAALAKAKAWEAGEADRLAAAEAEWRKQSAKALSDATARYEAAEGMLTQMRMQTDRARSEAVGGSIKSNNRTRFGAKTADRGVDTVAIQLPTQEDRGIGTQGSKIALRSNQMMFEPEPHAPKKRGALRDVIVAASLAILVIVAYPLIEPFLPPSWQSNIAAITGGFGPSPSGSDTSLVTMPAMSSNAAAQGLALVVREVNLRVGPSTTEKVVAALPRGLNVKLLERRGDWAFVQIDSESSQPRRGWVYGSFLKQEARSVEKAPPE